MPLPLGPLNEKPLDEQVNDLAKYFAKLIIDKDFDIACLQTSGKLRLKCLAGDGHLVNKIDGIVETYVQAAVIVKS